MIPLSAPKSDFLRISIERELFYQCSNFEALDKHLNEQCVTGYIGFDCTAPSFHIGNLVQIMRLYWLGQTGHRPVALLGGATTLIGDPSGKDETRKLLSKEQINKNKTSLKKTFSRFINFEEGANPALFVDNLEWLSKLNNLSFLRKIGPHFSINRMLSFDSVSERLKRDQEMSFIEFNYMILQAYDFIQLREQFGCTLQMGGTDQWGNLVSGLELGRRMGFRDLFALTCDLITTADGRKMGKSAQGAVWLDADLLSPNKYWRFWRDTADADVLRFMRIFTTMPLQEITRLNGIRGNEMHDLKVLLANEATTLLHGKTAAHNAYKSYEA